MSLESAKSFLERANRDKGFAKNFEVVDSPDAFMEIARGWGYDFTQEDLKYAFVTLSNMSEEELRSVSGGETSIPWDSLFQIDITQLRSTVSPVETFSDT